jgi:hypothetical protein
VKTFTLTIDSAADLVARNRDLIVELGKLLPVTETQRKGLLEDSGSPVYNLANLCGPVPGSESHHDAAPGGLFRHSLLTAVTGLKIFHSKNDPSMKDFEKLALTTFFACLCHDLGKLWFVRVTDQQRKWTPSKGPLLQYFPVGTQVSCIFRYGRGRTGHTGHEALSLLLLNLVINLGQLSWIGLTQANNLIATLSASLDCVLDDIRFYLEQGDRGATAAVIAKPVSKPSPPPPFGSSRADEFLLGFRQLASSGRLRANTHDGNVFISSTHTVIPIHDKGRVPGLLRQIYEVNRNQVLAGSYGGQAGHFYKTGDPTTFVDEIANRCKMLGTDAWCLSDPEAPPDRAPEIRHYWTMWMTRGGGTNTRRSVVLVFRNPVLWGEVDPVRDFGLCRTPMLFMTYDSRKLSLDPEDLGFLPADAKVVQASATRGAKPSPEDERIQSLFDAARHLWHTCDRLTPINGKTPRHQMLRRLDSQLRDQRSVASQEFIHEVIVSAVDRLRDLAARCERGERVAVADVAPLESESPEPPATHEPASSEEDDVGSMLMAAFNLIWSLPRMPEVNTASPSPTLVYRHGDRYLVPWPTAVHAAVVAQRGDCDSDRLEDEFAHCLRMAPVVDQLGVVMEDGGVGFIHRFQVTVGTTTIPAGRYLVVDRSRMKPPAAMPPAPTTGTCCLVTAVMKAA